MLKPFISGAISMACFTIALFLLRFWRRTHDRLFLMFGAAFLLMMIERIILVLTNSLLFVDFIIFPQIDLAIWRSGTTLAALCLFLYGLIFDSQP